MIAHTQDGGKELTKRRQMANPLATPDSRGATNEM